MPITVEHQEQGDWTVSLVADTPQAVLDAIDVRTYAYASIVVTAAHYGTSDLADATFLDAARYTGVYLGQSDDRRNLEGAGLIWWLGDDSDGGDLYTGNSGTSGALDLEAQLDARIFTSLANGLTKGTVDTLATTRDINIKMGTTRRQFLDTICALYPSGPYEWRVNGDGSVDVNQAADLWATVTTPTTALAPEGGRDGAISSVRADLTISGVSVEDYRTDIFANWDGTSANHGSATNTPPSGWVDFAGGAPDLTTLINYQPRVPFRERPNRSLAYNADAFAADALSSTTQATALATRHAANVGSYNLDLDADIDEYDPWRFDLTPGNNVYVYDPALGLYNTSGDEVYYRGEVIHPTEARVRSMTTPIQDGYGVYLRYWSGAAFSYYDLTPFVEFEDDVTTLELGSRRRLHRKNVRPRRINRQRFLRRQRQYYRAAVYASTVQ